nr:EOG090X0F73 [Triops cancriformis]
MFQSPEMHPYSTPPPEHALPITRKRDVLPPVVQSEPSSLSKPVTEQTEADQPVNLTARATEASPSTVKDSTLVVDTPSSQASTVAPQDLNYAEKNEAEDEEAAKVLAEMASGKTEESLPMKPIVTAEMNESEIHLKEENRELKAVQEEPKQENEIPKEIKPSLEVQEEVKGAEQSKEELETVKEYVEQVQDEPKEAEDKERAQELLGSSAENHEKEKTENIQENFEESKNGAKMEKEPLEEENMDTLPAVSILPTPEPEPSALKGPAVQLEDPEPMDVDTTLKNEDLGVVVPVSVPSKESIAVAEKPVEDELSSNKSVRGSPVPPVEEIEVEEGVVRSPTPQPDASEAQRDLPEPQPSSLEPASRETEQVMGGRDDSVHSSPRKVAAEEEEKPSKDTEELPARKEEAGSEDKSARDNDKGFSKEVEEQEEKGPQEEPGEEKVVETEPKTEDSEPLPEKKASPVVEKESKADEEEDELQIEKDDSEDEESIQKRSDQQMSDSDSGSDDDTQRLGGQKRRWTSSVPQQPSEPVLIISTESLKEIVPDAKLLAASEVRLTSPEPERPERVKRPRLHNAVAEPVASAPVKKERTISVQDAEPEPLAPANNPASNVIIVTNLVRPFTINQLRELLSRTGNLVANAFWIDRVKSTCLAQYESVEEAVATRSALHGVHWPISNPKTLVVDFATEQELQDCRDGRKESLNAPTTSNTNAAAQSALPEKLPVEEQSNSTNRRAKEEKEERGWEVRGPVREWDRAKIGEVVPGEREFKREQEKREREREDRTVRSREEQTAASGTAKDETPAKLLDDLFRKTKATPCIYWLPLTAEQIAEKEEMRRQRIAEREKRLAESQRAREESARARSERDRRDHKPRRDSSPRRR